MRDAGEPPAGKTDRRGGPRRSLPPAGWRAALLGSAVLLSASLPLHQAESQPAAPQPSGAVPAAPPQATAPQATPPQATPPQARPPQARPPQTGNNAPVTFTAEEVEYDRRATSSPPAARWRPGRTSASCAPTASPSTATPASPPPRATSSCWRRTGRCCSPTAPS
ncbi:hypothetical protein [Teichococcus aestuarii]|uniref:hypothetical protein n=1 Tax=Teichococcus aestuarii TaxID=568898 RepID=UPI0036139717